MGDVCFSSGELIGQGKAAQKPWRPELASSDCRGDHGGRNAAAAQIRYKVTKVTRLKYGFTFNDVTFNRSSVWFSADVAPHLFQS